MRSAVRPLFLPVLMLLAPATGLFAQTHPCAAVAVPAERLACYDKAFPPAPEVAEAALRRARDDFGLDPPAEPLSNPGQQPDALAPDRVEARVASVEHGNGGRRTILLEGGQAWTVVEATSSGPLRQGDVVVVRKGLMGGFLLTTPGGVTLRVRRTR